MKMTDIYTLDENNNVIPCTNILEQAAVWDDPERRIVKKTELRINGEDILFSTVFVGIDTGSVHHSPDVKPRVFETAMFVNDQINSPYIVGRWTSWEEAEREHEKAVSKVKK